MVYFVQNLHAYTFQHCLDTVFYLYKLALYYISAECLQNFICGHAASTLSIQAHVSLDNAANTLSIQTHVSLEKFL